MQHRDGLLWFTLNGNVSSRNGSNGFENFCRITSEAIGHHSAVGHTNGKNFGFVDIHLTSDLVYHLINKTHIVDFFIASISTAAICIPRGELARWKAACAIRESDNKTFFVGLRNKFIKKKK